MPEMEMEDAEKKDEFLKETTISCNPDADEETKNGADLKIGERTKSYEKNFPSSTGNEPINSQEANLKDESGFKLGNVLEASLKDDTTVQRGYAKVTKEFTDDGDICGKNQQTSSKSTKESELPNDPVEFSRTSTGNVSQSNETPTSQQMVQIHQLQKDTVHSDYGNDNEADEPNLKEMLARTEKDIQNAERLAGEILDKWKTRSEEEVKDILFISDELRIVVNGLVDQMTRNCNIVEGMPAEAPLKRVWEAICIEVEQLKLLADNIRVNVGTKTEGARKEDASENTQE